MIIYQLCVMLLLNFTVCMVCIVMYVLVLCVFCLLLLPSYVQVFQVDQHNLTGEITCLNVFCLFIYLSIKIVNKQTIQCLLCLVFDLITRLPCGIACCLY